MDSCAISHMASLFVEYTEKKTSVFQVQLDFGSTWHCVSGWCSSPPGKVGFCPSCNFSNLFPPKWLRMTNFTRFVTFPIFSHWSGSEWPILPDLQLFETFPTEVAQNDLEWPILPNLQLFQSLPTKVAQNDSEWPISPDSQLSNLSTEVAQNDWQRPILPDSQLFQSFPTKVARNDWEWPIHQICKLFQSFHWSTSEWLGMANFTWFTAFPIFSHQSGS